MPFIQKNTPPPNKIMTFSLKNFAGGINNRSDILQPNEAHRLLNMSFEEDELMAKRKGTDAFNEHRYSNPVEFMDEFMPYNDTNQFLTSTRTELFVNHVKLRSVSGAIEGVNFNGKYFFTDGDKLFAYGKFPQASTTYEKIVGTPSANYRIMEIANPPENYTPLDSSHTRGVVQYDYTNGKVWYEPCTNEEKDTSKGFNVLPEKVKYIVVHGGRLYVSGADKDDDNVFITDVRNPFYFPVSLPIQLPPNSDKIVGMCVYDNSVVVGRHEDIHVIQGVTNNPDLGLPMMELRKLNSHTGLANNRAMSVAHNYLFFLGSDSVVYVLSSVNQTEKVLSTSILSKQLDLLKDPFHLSKSDMKGAVSYFHDEEWFLSIKDIVLVYSYRHRAWTYYKGLDARSFYHKDHELIWGDKDGRISHFIEERLDHGIPYEAYWTSKMFDMDDANAHKQFREFFIVAHTYNDVNSDVRLTFEIDYVDVKSEVVIQNQISVWGRSRFGDRFITRNINASLPFVIGRRGRGIRFTFTNGFTLSASVEKLVDLEFYTGVKNGILVFVSEENAYYTFQDGVWYVKTIEYLNQAMKIYQVNGEYEYRGKR